MVSNVDELKKLDYDQNLGVMVPVDTHFDHPADSSAIESYCYAEGLPFQFTAMDLDSAQNKPIEGEVEEIMERCDGIKMRKYNACTDYTVEEVEQMDFGYCSSLEHEDLVFLANEKIKEETEQYFKTFKLMSLVVRSLEELKALDKGEYWKVRFLPKLSCDGIMTREDEAMENEIENYCEASGLEFTILQPKTRTQVGSVSTILHPSDEIVAVPSQNKQENELEASPILKNLSKKARNYEELKTVAEKYFAENEKIDVVVSSLDELKSLDIGQNLCVSFKLHVLEGTVVTDEERFSADAEYEAVQSYCNKWGLIFCDMSEFKCQV